MSKITKGIALSMMLVLASVVLVACWGDDMDKKLTTENYNLIVVSETTYEDAKELFGDPTGGELDQNGDGTLVWKNKKGDKEITLEFDNNVVVEKEEKGVVSNRT